MRGYNIVIIPPGMIAFICFTFFKKFLCLLCDPGNCQKSINIFSSKVHPIFTASHTLPNNHQVEVFPILALSNNHAFHVNFKKTFLLEKYIRSQFKHVLSFVLTVVSMGHFIPNELISVCYM